MHYSRRDFGLLLPALAAAGVATAQTPALPSKTYAFDGCRFGTMEQQEPRCS
jgi:hypothetical protein